MLGRKSSSWSTVVRKSMRKSMRKQKGGGEGFCGCGLLSRRAKEDAASHDAPSSLAHGLAD